MIKNKEDQAKLDKAIELLKEIDIDGESTQELLGTIGMEHQMLRQLVMSSPTEQTHALMFEKRDVDDIMDKRLYNSQQLFILTAVAGTCMETAQRKFSNFTDNHGYAVLYELIMDIVDEMLFTEGCEYQKFLNDKEQDDWFSTHHNTCMDWYFMDKGRELLEARLEGHEAVSTSCLKCGKNIYHEKNLLVKEICNDCSDEIFLAKSQHLLKDEKIFISIVKDEKKEE